MSKTILYARTSTSDQTVELQRIQAEQSGFVIDQVIEDGGVSGVSVPLAERPNGKGYLIYCEMVTSWLCGGSIG